MKNNNIGYAGLGVMGQHMAANIQKSINSDLYCWNRTSPSSGTKNLSSLGAIICDNYDDLISNVGILCICVSDGIVVQELLMRNKDRIGNSDIHTIIDFSTIEPEQATHFHDEFTQIGVDYIDAPVSGGDVGAEKGTLTIMVGSSKVKQQVELIFNVVGSNIFYCGHSGAGQVVKAINQVICAINMTSICEALSIADLYSIDKQLIVNVCSTGAAGSWALQHLGAEISRGNYEPGFMIKHMVKDLNIVERSKDDLYLPAFDHAKKQFEYMINPLKAGDLGTQALYELYKLDT